MRTLSSHELWARMLVQFTDQYRLVLRLDVISLLIPAETSECERIFSLMLWQDGERQQGKKGKKERMNCRDDTSQSWAVWRDDWRA